MYGPFTVATLRRVAIFSFSQSAFAVAHRTRWVGVCAWRRRVCWFELLRCSCCHVQTATSVSGGLQHRALTRFHSFTHPASLEAHIERIPRPHVSLSLL